MAWKEIHLETNNTFTTHASSYVTTFFKKNNGKEEN